jgi:hypothetical protein
MKDDDFAKLFKAVRFLKPHGNSLRFQTDIFKSFINEHIELQALIVTLFRIQRLNNKQFWCIRIGKLPANGPCTFAVNDQPCPSSSLAEQERR